MMLLFFSRRFEKQRKRLTKPIKIKLSERLRLFAQTPFDSLLENHSLHGTYAGYRSINITGNYRAIYYHEDPNIVRFIAVDTHHNLFGA